MVPTQSSPSGADAAAESRPYRFCSRVSGSPVNAPFCPGRSTNTARAAASVTSSRSLCATHPPTPGRSGQLHASVSAPGAAR